METDNSNLSLYQEENSFPERKEILNYKTTDGQKIKLILELYPNLPILYLFYNEEKTNSFRLPDSQNKLDFLLKSIHPLTKYKPDLEELSMILENRILCYDLAFSKDY